MLLLEDMRLESYAPVISEHLALITWFSDHKSCKYWQAELDAWATAMKRYNKGKRLLLSRFR